MKNKALFKNKYRVKSTRLECWDYSNPGFYFVTICTKDRVNMFGEIKEEKMILNELGYIVKQYLKQIDAHFRFIKIDSFIIMPNHVHLIMSIRFKQRRDVAMLRLYGNAQMSNISPKSGSLSSIIRSYKSICKKIINIQFKHYSFRWQQGFYDRIMRTDLDLWKCRKYIQNNPSNWENDRNYRK